MNPVPFRIKLGVTGLRDNLPDMALLKGKIRELLGIEELENDKEVIPNSDFSLFDDAPITLLKNIKNAEGVFSMSTALAEGNDRTLADAVFQSASKFEVV